MENNSNNNNKTEKKSVPLVTEKYFLGRQEPDNLNFGVSLLSVFHCDKQKGIEIVFLMIFWFPNVPKIKQLK